MVVKTGALPRAKDLLEANAAHLRTSGCRNFRLSIHLPRCPRACLEELQVSRRCHCRTQLRIRRRTTHTDGGSAPCHFHRRDRRPCKVSRTPNKCARDASGENRRASYPTIMAPTEARRSRKVLQPLLSPKRPSASVHKFASVSHVAAVPAPNPIANSRSQESERGAQN